MFEVDSFGISAGECLNFEKSIIDYREHLDPQFKKIKRNSTRYIIIHTSECDLKTTLKIVAKGKQDNHKWISRGGHSHYVIARNGHTYFILGNEYRAHHAGLSIGIELIGYHNQEITAKQYKSVQFLIKILKDKYHLDVLTHSQVAYAKPNEYNPHKHRGRKHCAQNFDRIHAGLNTTWLYDPDVKAGRLAPEPKLAAIFYGVKSQP
jgi:N-acetyl-anhydromuramyl-L-alanine amidase AmpD